MPRSRLSDLLGGMMLGLAQIFSPIRQVLPAPPEQGFMLPPNLNTCSLEDLLELGLEPELAGRILEQRPYLNLRHLASQFPEVEPWVWEGLEGRVRF